jgi:hypothetical protein
LPEAGFPHLGNILEGKVAKCIKKPEPATVAVYRILARNLLYGAIETEERV